MEGIISVNGAITPALEAKIGVTDRGLLFGDNIFEVFAGFGNKILDLTDHLERLRTSAEIHGIPIPWTNEELQFEMESLLEQTSFSKSYIRLAITRGFGFGLSTDPSMKPNKIIYCLPAKIEDESIYTKGLRLKKKKSSINETGKVAKTGNYIRSITALAEAKSTGYDDVLWTNANQEITEASTSNIFLIGREGDLVEIATPTERSGLLLGITRKRIITLLTNASINVTERLISEDEIPRFDEGFLCSTVRGLVPLAEIDGHRLHSTRSAAVFHHIERLYMTWVETEVGYRVHWNTGKRIEEV
ncbi:MAG: aminotransferase class IV [Pseudobacteriovorax sp.]|nr:aminotransferase class IV [Pseudobacteriovorax sp.]